ncbi:MAG: hypothetical protein AAF719_06565 [Pseudomonadota bacterium]
MSKAPSLGEFLESSIVEIVRGVGGAAKEVATYGATLVPYEFNDLEGLEKSRQTHGPIRTIRFDVAVTIEKSKTGSAGFKVAVPAFDVSFDASSDGEKSTNYSRIKFSVPILLEPSKKK